MTKYNERNPGKEILYLNYGAIDPVMTNAKCSYWHFRFEADVNMMMAALTNFMKGRPNIKKVYLINQDYSFGQAVHAAARAMLNEKRPDIEIVGDELHPSAEGHRFLPLYRQDQGVRRRHRDHRQLGAGHGAAAQGGRRRGAENRLVHLLRQRRRRPDGDQADRIGPSRFRSRGRLPEFGPRGGAKVRDGVPRQGGHEPVVSARGQRDEYARQGDRPPRPTTPSRSPRSSRA